MLKMHPVLIAASLVASTALAGPSLENFGKEQNGDNASWMNSYCGSWVDFTSFAEKVDYVPAQFCWHTVPYAELHWGCQKPQYQNGYIWYSVAGDGPQYPCHAEPYTGSCPDSTCDLIP
jgi:hypothetical protein